jgi:hypothetical protein
LHTVHSTTARQSDFVFLRTFQAGPTGIAWPGFDKLTDCRLFAAPFHLTAFGTLASSGIS